MWLGYPIRNLLARAKPKAGADMVLSTSIDGFTAGSPLSVLQDDKVDALLAIGMNGAPLPLEHGFPVRMVVPEAYGFKSIKWLQRVVLTNDWQANDTYALGNNDLESPMKTFARFVQVPSPVQAGEQIAVTGLAQVGVSGLSKVQCWLHPVDMPLPADDRYFERGNWQDATILPPPDRWGGGLRDGGLPETDATSALLPLSQ